MPYIPYHHHDPTCAYGTVCQAYENGTSFCQCYVPPYAPPTLMEIIIPGIIVIVGGLCIGLLLDGGFRNYVSELWRDR